MIRKTIIFFILLLFISLSQLLCKKDYTTILTDNQKLSEDAMINLELSKLKKSVENAKDDFERSSIYQKISSIESEKGDITSSIKSANQSIKFYPRMVEAHHILGKSYLTAGRYVEAEKELLTAIELNLKYAPAHFELGNLYYKKMQFSKAIEEYLKAIKHDALHYKSYNNLGVIYYMNGNTKKAEEAFRRVIELKPDFSRVYKNIGILYEVGIKKRGVAIRYYKMYLKYSPNAIDRKAVKLWIAGLGG